jgi:acetyl-CoA carboxylase biotin carboxylase subunit
VVVVRRLPDDPLRHPLETSPQGMPGMRQAQRIGLPLALSQRDIVLRGAAIECRINAEDPGCQFAPTPGMITELTLPGGPFARVDTHAHPGYLIPPEYDSMIAKVIVWAADREGAIVRMRCALDELTVRGQGVSTTTRFLRDVLDSSAFRKAEHSTSAIDDAAIRYPAWTRPRW